MIVGNFTPDPINFTHQGITGTIPACKEGSQAHVVEMDDARARHILNKFTKIGLVQMQFGDDPEVKAKESVALYNRFWEHQIEVFNQNNEQQKEQGNRYSKPTDLLAEKAKAFGLEIKRPWMVPRKDDEAVKVLREENAELKAANKEQGRQIAQILEMLKGQNAEPVKVEPDAITVNRKRYSSLVERTMKGWLKNNWDDVEKMPEENQFEIKTKYQEIYETPFPTEKPA